MQIIPERESATDTTDVQALMASSGQTDEQPTHEHELNDQEEFTLGHKGKSTTSSVQEFTLGSKGMKRVYEMTSSSR